MSCAASVPSPLARVGERIGRNPRTGDEVAVPGKAVPHFKTGKELRELLNLLDGPSAAPGSRRVNS